MIVRQITIEQRDILRSIEDADGNGSRFNPVLDAGDTPLDEFGYHVLDENGEPTGLNRNWFISNEEVAHCKDNDLYNDWIHSLPEIEHNPVKIEI